MYPSLGIHISMYGGCGSESSSCLTLQN
uniref:Uncharacterized protein n=1 Tax=Nelumbo nucifera TaxID=4432 RepID=A0A822YLT8_NELNU|nr:TPA_asm: hypothetical protein HUJ06_009161 [Nelumbo nucifera]DAD33040.1 TPA_asm: hypothetical protein HUJ06_011892 [Nelumbo nucifera]DAD33042.1 TPA_asm: hypothetical protein HUJ06_011893 [Nelumbo nucifera]DAD33043.1 TPA_asm: hypothetical protein HUJ06_011894 [Nelumbo nucifera]DAD33044.1 TPA_asm: hypothetical protein HUJ06_011895 [Nelumbo nucifera]